MAESLTLVYYLSYLSTSGNRILPSLSFLYVTENNITIKLISSIKGTSRILAFMIGPFNPWARFRLNPYPNREDP